MVTISPLRAVWDIKKDYPYSCFNQDYFLMISGCINTTTDFICTVFPAFVVIKLQIPQRQKMAVVSVFLVGIMVNVCSALRIYYNFVQARSGDLWLMMPCMIPGMLELGLGMVGLLSCLPLHCQLVVRLNHSLTYL